MEQYQVDCMAFGLALFLLLALAGGGVGLIILGTSEEPPEMQPNTYRDLNLTHSYWSEEDWLSWFQEQRQKIVLLTAGPPLILIAFGLFLRPIVIYQERVQNRQLGINVPNWKFSVRKNALIFATIMLLSIGLALTVVGNVAPASFWLLRGCEICKEKNFQFQRQLKVCRIIGPLAISFGILLPIVCILYRHVKKKIGDDEDINGLIHQMLLKYLCCMRTCSSELGDVPADPVTGSDPRNSAQQPEGQCLHPIGSAQPSPTQYRNASPQLGQSYQPNRAELPPPSYESVVNQNLALPSAPPPLAVVDVGIF